MKKLTTLTAMIILSACARHRDFGVVQGPPGPPGAEGPQGPEGPPLTPPAPTTVEQIVANYNENTFASTGADPITPGLKCTLYTIPNLPANPCLLSTSIAGCTALSTTTGYASVASWTYIGSIDQTNQAGSAGFDLLPQALQPLYATNFAVTCTGYFVNPDFNYHNFDVQSDDGALLYINGSLVVNNDGEHAIADVMGEKYLQQQVYSFQLNYFQGPGLVALIVNEDGQLLPQANLYH